MLAQPGKIGLAQLLKTNKMPSRFCLAKLPPDAILAAENPCGTPGTLRDGAGRDGIIGERSSFHSEAENALCARAAACVSGAARAARAAQPRKGSSPAWGGTPQAARRRLATKAPSKAKPSPMPHGMRPALSGTERLTFGRSRATGAPRFSVIRRQPAVARRQSG